MSWPSSRIWPSTRVPGMVSFMRFRQRRKVDLPQPDGPMSAVICWALISIEISASAQHPDLNISVTGGGSGTGIAALINGTADLANASRAITPEEIAKAKANGITPVQHVIARDAIAVLVNPGNPVNQLTLPQLSAL